MMYLWDDVHGGRFDTGRFIIPVDGVPLPGIYSKLRYEPRGRSMKVVSGAEVPLTSIEVEHVRAFLKDYL